jgi:hypothetical protein
VQYEDSYTEKDISKAEEACSQEYMPTGKKKGFFKIKRIYRFKLITWLFKCMQQI